MLLGAVNTVGPSTGELECSLKHAWRWQHERLMLSRCSCSRMCRTTADALLPALVFVELERHTCGMTRGVELLLLPPHPHPTKKKKIESLLFPIPGRDGNLKSSHFLALHAIFFPLSNYKKLHNLHYHFYINFNMCVHFNMFCY